MAYRRTFRILCVCNNDITRSPMLAAVLASKFRTRFEPAVCPVVESGGIPPGAVGLPADSDWREIGGETGIDLSEHYSKLINGMGNLSRFDFVICVERSMAVAVSECGVLPEKIIVANAPDGIPNPWQKGPEAYRECHQIIREFVDAVVGDFVAAVRAAATATT